MDPLTKLIWVDLETSGVTATSAILEIACVITDFTGKDRQFHFHRIMHVPDDAVWEPIARQMHENSGLLRKSQTCKLSQKQGMAEFKMFLGSVTTGPGTSADRRNRLVLAGRGIHFDRYKLTSHDQQFDTLVSHRMLDVTSVRMAVEAAGGWTNFNPIKAHRAMDDALQAIEEYKSLLQVFRLNP